VADQFPDGIGKLIIEAQRILLIGEIAQRRVEQVMFERAFQVPLDLLVHGLLPYCSGPAVHPSSRT
jgi:hypothetical protein